MLDGKDPLVYEAADPILVLFLILVEMGFGFLSSLLLLALVVRCFGSQQPNTDGFFLSDFLKRMGYELPSSAEYTSSSVCSWKGVSCDSKGEKVFSFVASDLGLSGPMPDNTIGKLSKLQVLDLSVNNITGLSTDLWGLGSSLKRLNLSMNRIQGPLPNNIGNFGNMESLDLSHNGFSGEIPTNIGSMLTLRLLNLSKNSFEGTVPDGIADCRNLVALDLSGNRIRGKMPDFSGLESLSHLNLSGNFLNDSILGVLKEGLKVVDLSNNLFQDQVSAGKLDLNFSVSSLVYLDISGNHLNAEFFSNLSLALSLKHLNLAGNRLSHKKFPNLQLPSRLDYLNLSETSLNGNISPEISKLVGLKTLDLSKNHLVGEIPDLSIVVNLQILDLSSNNLTGEIPTPILHKLPNMKWFNLSYNNLSFCKETSSLQTFNYSFIGLQNSCPIAANPDVIASTGINQKRWKLAMAIGFSVACLLIGIACFAFARGRSTNSWAMKQLSYKEDDNVTGPYSFNTDSTMWVADVRSATSVPVVMFEKPLLSFTFADLLAATSNFDRGTLLAEGRHGPVYRGFLPGLMHVAIKVLPRRPASNDQDDARELEILGRMRHPNIVPLIGYCLAGDQRIAIYEYMENGNLQNLLHDLPLGIQATEDWSSDTWEDETNGVQKITTSGVSTWRFRHRIALGVARALAFLHHGCFPQAAHRDLKSSKVYLDASLEPRLSYFGLEKVAGSELEDVAYRGSPGYAPPELSDPELDVFSAATPKADVFGFGVILFELITGKKALGDHYPEGRSTSLVDWARVMVRSNQCLVVIDSKIRETESEKEMEEALRIAYLCTADLPSKRPSMQQVVGLLKDIEPVS